MYHAVYHYVPSRHAQYLAHRIGLLATALEYGFSGFFIPAGALRRILIARHPCVMCLYL